MNDNGACTDSFVYACAKAGNMVRAREALDEMVMGGIQPTESTLTSFINGVSICSCMRMLRAVQACARLL